MIVNYQPVIELASGKVAKVEVLGRPKAPGKRISDVIRSAEQSGDIKRMTDQILDLALAEWHKVARSDIELSINLSLRNLDEKDLPKRVVKALKRHHLDPNSLWLEIDEKAQQLTNGQWLDRMRELQSVGVRFSVDSFGAEITQATAYDLARLPIAELKIDGPVVSDSDSNMDHRGSSDRAPIEARNLREGDRARRDRRLMHAPGMHLWSGLLLRAADAGRRARFDYRFVQGAAHERAHESVGARGQVTRRGRANLACRPEGWVSG